MVAARRRRAHSPLETDSAFGLISRWTRLPLAVSEEVLHIRMVPKNC